MDENIAKVTNNAMQDLLHNGMEKTIEGCIANNWFITYIQAEQSIPIKINGVYRQPEPKCYVIIDTTKPMEYHDWRYYQEYSQFLFNMFDSIEKWYQC